MPASLLHAVMAIFAASQSPCAAPVHGRLVPTDFVGNRVFARWHLTNRGDLRLYTDTGGGGFTVFPAAVRRLGIAVDTTVLPGRTVLETRIPIAMGDPHFPSIFTGDTTAVRFNVEENPPPDEQPGYIWDGRLGGQWFADRVWTFDYPHRRLYYNGTDSTGPLTGACWVSLGFQVTATGRRTTNFPRIAATVAGEEIQFLLDTGARTELTTEAWAVIEPREPRYRATSFIIADRFEKWHLQHPEWLVVEHAEVGGDGAAMIRVPAIEIGGQKIGPVWFTKRPNRSFRDFMSQYTDQPVEGALGGSAWRYGTLTVDYPRARAAVMLSRVR